MDHKFHLLDKILLLPLRLPRSQNLHKIQNHTLHHNPLGTQIHHNHLHQNLHIHSGHIHPDPHHQVPRVLYEL